MTARSVRPIIAQTNGFWSLGASHSSEAGGMSMSRRESPPPPQAERTSGPVATPASTDSAAESADVTGLLVAWSEGDAAALDALLPLVYAELRRLARRALRHEAAGHTLQPTADASWAPLRGHPGFERLLAER